MIRRFTLATVGVLLLSKDCWAFSWSKKINQRVFSPTPAHPSPINDAVPSGEEIETLLLNQEILKDYGQRPDCFRKAAGLIRTRCGELDMNEDERIKAAISMTLCELATARHHSVPFECTPFTVDFISTSSGPHSQGECVDALSRSAQFWSSYSGYLREVPQLCFAFRRWHDIDTAREIYRNITMEKVALIQFIIKHENLADLLMRKWENHLQNLQEMISQMQATANALDTGVQDLGLHLGKEYNDALEIFTTTVTDLKVRQVDHAYNLLHQTEKSLAEITQHHSQDLRQFMSSLELKLMNNIDSIFIRSQTDNQASLNLANQAQRQWYDLTSQIGDLTHSIIILSSTASEIVSLVNDSTQQASHLNRLHLEISDSASQLAETVVHLTVTTHTELEKINVSAASIQEKLFLQDYGTLRLLTPALGFLFPAGMAPFNRFNGLPVFRICLAILDFVGYLCRTVLSGIMATTIIFFSYRKYLINFIPSFGKTNLSSQAPAQPLDRLCYIPCSPPLYHLPQVSDSATKIPRNQRLRASRIPERLLYATV